MTPVAKVIEPGTKRSRRRRWVIGLLLLAVIALGTAGGYAWRRHTTVMPPEIPLEEADPALAQVIVAARQQVIAEPRSASAWGHLGKLLLASHYEEQAAVCLAQAQRLDGDDPRWPYLRADALLLHDPAAAIPLLRQAVLLCERSDPGNSAPRLRLAETLLAQGQTEEAEDHLRRVLETEPDNARAHLALGRLTYGRGELQECLTHLQRCEHNPQTRQKACSLLAAVHQRLGHVETAATYSRKAAAPPADRPWDDPFIREYQRLAQVGTARFRMVESMEAAGRPADAVRILQEMIQESPDYRAYIGLGKNYLQLGDYSHAEEALQNAARMAPDKAPAYYYLSKLCWLQGEHLRKQDGDRSGTDKLFQRAADQARQAIERKPDHALAYLFLGLSLRRLGQREQGLDALHRAVQYGPDATELYLHLSEALAEDGRLQDARAQLEQAIKVARPEDSRPRAALERLGGGGNKAD